MDVAVGNGRCRKLETVMFSVNSYFSAYVGMIKREAYDSHFSQRISSIEALGDLGCGYFEIPTIARFCVLFHQLFGVVPLVLRLV